MRKLHIRKQIGRVQFPRSKSGEQRAEQKPGDRGTVKEQNRQARGRVDQGAFDVFDIADRHVRLRCRSQPEQARGRSKWYVTRDSSEKQLWLKSAHGVFPRTGNGVPGAEGAGEAEGATGALTAAEAATAAGVARAGLGPRGSRRRIIRCRRLASILGIRAADRSGLWVCHSR